MHPYIRTYIFDGGFIRVRCLRIAHDFTYSSLRHITIFLWYCCLPSMCELMWMYSPIKSYNNIGACSRQWSFTPFQALILLPAQLIKWCHHLPSTNTRTCHCTNILGTECIISSYYIHVGCPLNWGKVFVSLEYFHAWSVLHSSSSHPW